MRPEVFYVRAAGLVGDVIDAERIFPVLRDEVPWPDLGTRKKIYMVIPDANGQTHCRPDRMCPLHPVVSEIATAVGRALACRFDTICLNYYPSGLVGLGWHSDDSEEIDQESPVAIVSFGETRALETRPMADRTAVRRYTLHPGSVFVMPAGFQLKHEHRVPPSGTGVEGRISLQLSKRP